MVIQGHRPRCQLKAHMQFPITINLDVSRTFSSLCLGAFRTSPATSLHVEANEMPRRLASQYSLKISSNMNNSARICAFVYRFTKLFDKRPGKILPLGLRVKTDLSAVGFKPKDTFISPISPVPCVELDLPWIFSLGVFIHALLSRAYLSVS